MTRPRLPSLCNCWQNVGLITVTRATGAERSRLLGRYLSYGVAVATVNLPRRGLFVTVTSNAGPSQQQQAFRIGRPIVQAAR